MTSSKVIIDSDAQKRSWLYLVLNVNFMTLNILKLDFFFTCLEFIINSRALLQNFVHK